MLMNIKIFLEFEIMKNMPHFGNFELKDDRNIIR